MKPIYFIAIFSPLLPILTFLLFFKSNKQEKSKRVIFILLIVSLIFDFLGFNLAQKLYPTITLINLYLVIEVSFLYVFFNQIFEKNKLAQTTTKIGFVLVLLVWLYNNIIKGSIDNNYDYISITIEFIIIFILCLLYFLQVITKIKNTIPVYNTIEFWLIAALLLYCAATMFSFFIPITKSDRTNDTIAFEYISRIASILKNILFSIAFMINTNKCKNDTEYKPQSIYNIDQH